MSYNIPGNAAAPSMFLNGFTYAIIAGTDVLGNNVVGLMNCPGNTLDMSIGNLFYQVPSATPGNLQMSDITPDFNTWLNNVATAMTSALSNQIEQLNKSSNTPQTIQAVLEFINAHLTISVNGVKTQ